MTPQFSIPPDIADHYLRCIELSFKSGQEDRAIAAVRQAFRTADENREVKLDTPLANILNQRLANTLDSCEIYTVSDLLATTEEELLHLAQVSTVSCAHARDVLRRHGFDWSNTPWMEEEPDVETN